MSSITVEAVFMKEEMLDSLAKASVEETSSVVTGRTSLCPRGNRWLMSSVELDDETRSRDKRLDDRTLASFLPGVGVNEDIKMIFLMSSKVD
jgi:hypothetical protein